MTIRSDFFSAAQEEVLQELASKPYLSFLKSDIYLIAIQRMQRVGCDNSREAFIANSGQESPPIITSAITPPTEPALAAVNAVVQRMPLPSLPEGQELVRASLKTASATMGSSRSLSSNRGGVRVRGPPPQTFITRLEGPIPPSTTGVAASQMAKAHASMMRYRQVPNPPNPYHTDYVTVVPNSAQDSELHSMSTDTDTQVSGADPLERIPTQRISRHEKHRDKTLRSQNLLQNQGRTGSTDQLEFIPRTQQQPKPGGSALAEGQPNPSKDFSEFANLLVDKLEQWQQTDECFRRVITTLQSVENEGPPAADSGISVNSGAGAVGGQGRASFTHQQLKTALREIEGLSLADNDQSILDQHVSRIWSETPNRSPGGVSPSGAPQAVMPNFSQQQLQWPPNNPARPSSRDMHSFQRGAVGRSSSASRTSGRDIQLTSSEKVSQWNINGGGGGSGVFVDIDQRDPCKYKKPSHSVLSGGGKSSTKSKTRTGNLPPVGMSSSQPPTMERPDRGLAVGISNTALNMAGVPSGIISDSQRQSANGNRVSSMTMSQPAGQGSARSVPIVGGSIGRKMPPPRNSSLPQSKTDLFFVSEVITNFYVFQTKGR